MTAVIEPTVSGYKGTQVIEGLGTMQAYGTTREEALDRLMKRVSRAKGCHHVYYPSNSAKARKCSVCGIIRK